MFTERELQLIHTLAANEAEDVSALYQQQLEQVGITDADVLSYIEELKAVAATAQALLASLPIEDDPHEGAEAQYEPTTEDLAEADAILADAFAHEEGLLD